MAPKSAGLAHREGYKNVRAFIKGYPSWLKKGLLLVASDEFVKTGNIVLVDLRSPQEVKKSHIPRAVGIPLAELEDFEDSFPTRKSAPIVLYGSQYDAEEAAEIIKEWGYSRVSLVDGGIEGFAARGHQLTTGLAATEINWIRKLGKGEVTLEGFMKAVRGAVGTVILDVRTDDEVSAGLFDNAIHIPLDQIETRIAEIPKDKKILINCATGARAEMAWQTLLRAGYNVKFLVEKVECEAGACRVVE